MILAHLTTLILLIVVRTAETVECPSSVGSATLNLRAENSTLTSSTMTHLILNASFACPGRIHSWTYFRVRRNPVVFASVWRKEEAPSGYFRLVGKNPLPSGEIGQLTVNIASERQIRVNAGDFIGFFYSNEVYKNNNPGAVAIMQTNVTYHTLLAGYYDENFHVGMPHTFDTTDRREAWMKPALEANLNYTSSNNSLQSFSCPGESLRLYCSNGTINILVASFGNLPDRCQSASQSDCQADMTSALRITCDGKNSCSVGMDSSIIEDGCPAEDAALSVEYQCVPDVLSFSNNTEDIDFSLATTPPIRAMTSSTLRTSSSASQGASSVSGVISMTTAPMLPIQASKDSSTTESFSSSSVEQEKGSFITEMITVQSSTSSPTTTRASTTTPYLPSSSAHHGETSTKSVSFVHENIGAIISGVSSALLLIIISAALIIVIRRKNAAATPPSKLVQCHLLEPHLRRNPLYVQRNNNPHYQIATLQHHYERISSLSRKPPPGVNKYFHSIPNRKRVRGIPKAKPANGEDFPRHFPSPYPPQRPRSVELPPLPLDLETDQDGENPTSASTFPRLPSNDIISSIQESTDIYETVPNDDGSTSSENTQRLSSHSLDG